MVVHKPMLTFSMPYLQAKDIKDTDAAAEYLNAVDSIHEGQCNSGRVVDEQVISKSAWWSFLYARNVLKSRFALAEELILNSKYRPRYLGLYSMIELIEYLNINKDELLILKLKYNDEELKAHLIITKSNDIT